MNATKLEDLINAAEDLTEHIGGTVFVDAQRATRLLPKLVKALKEVGLEVKCDNCGGKGYITGATGGPVQTRGKCDVCKGTGSKYPFLEVS